MKKYLEDGLYVGAALFVGLIFAHSILSGLS